MSTCRIDAESGKGWIDGAQLQALAAPLEKNGYGQYLLRVLKETVY